MSTIRNFVPDDADAVSALFREVYGDRYVYCDLYVPTMIVWNNAQRHWQSAVAVENGCIVGHAALWWDEHAPCAELAMIATHPRARHLGVATRLGRHLCREARKQQLTTLTMKMVCSHPHSQRLAKNLGFYTTALLRDYVASPFNQEARESIILGVLALQLRPVPQIVEINGQNHWLSLISDQFGNTQPSFSSSIQTTSPLKITDIGGRVEVTVQQLTHRIIDELTRFPYNRLIYLRIQINNALAEALPILYRAGYRDMGLLPDNKGSWFWSFQRGFKRQDLQLSCPTAQVLQTHSLSV